MRGGDNNLHHYHHKFLLSPDSKETLDFGDLKIFSPVGRGAKGVVFLARTNDALNEKWLALKVVSKALLQKKSKRDDVYGHYKRIWFEQQILRRFDHPLLPRLHGILETKELLGFAIEYCHGGNMYCQRKKQSEKTFSEEAIRFYAVELVLALEYLHNLGVVYRDLKPENIMIQETGHIMLVDFDLAKKLNPKSPESLSCNSSPGSNSVSPTTDKERRRRRFSRFYCNCTSGIMPYDSGYQSETDSPSRSESESVEKSNSFVGTEDYVAPEVISGIGHNFGVDWWSLGVVLYEMLYGTTPFKGANRKETFHRILTLEPDLEGDTTPLRDLIRKLLEKDPERRIDVNEIKGHDFFKGVRWDNVLQIARPPFIPQNEIEDKAGISKRDVELFVHALFFPKKNGEGEKEKTAEVEKKGQGESNTEVEREKKKLEGENGENNNSNVWVDKVNQNPTQNEDFNIF